VVRPPLVGVKSADFSARRKSIEIGRQAMAQLIPELKAQLQTKAR